MFSLYCRQGAHQDCAVEVPVRRLDRSIQQVTCECPCHGSGGAGVREPRKPLPLAPVRTVEIEYEIEYEDTARKA